MSVEYSTGICYGTIIDKEEAEKFFNHIEEKLGAEMADEFIDLNCRCLNSWTGGDCFLGFIDDLGENPCMIDDSDISRYTVSDFEKMLEKYKLDEIIEDVYDYEPHYYVVPFVY